MKLCQFLLSVTLAVLLHTNSSYAHCTFGNMTVQTCEWTPWSKFTCDRCCAIKSIAATRTRGVCCGGDLTESDCLSTCGIQDTIFNRVETSNCSTCTCQDSQVTGKPWSENIYYKDADEANCGSQCSGDKDWGKCIQDCTVNKTTLCTILETNLFFLGLALGIFLTVLLAYLLWWKKYWNWAKKAPSATNSVQPL